LPATVRHSSRVEVHLYDAKEHKAAGKLIIGGAGSKPGVPDEVEWSANLKSGRVTFEKTPTKADGKTHYPDHFIEEAKKEILSVLGKVPMPFSHHVRITEDMKKSYEERQLATEKKSVAEKKESAAPLNSSK